MGYTATENDWYVLEAMRRYGGSFVQALAECFSHADVANYHILRHAFHEYWEIYQKVAAEKLDELK